MHIHRCPHSIALGLATLLLTQALFAAQKVRDGVVTYPDGYVLEVGEPGELPPPLETAGKASEIVILNGPEPAAPAPFLGGGASQRLLGLAAGAGGFTAAWNDSRDGNLALFLGVLDTNGEHPLDGAPVHLPRSSRQVLPSLAMLDGADAGIVAGGMSWTAQEMKGNAAMLRFFEAPQEPAVAGERASAAYLLDLPIPLGPLENTSPVRLALTADTGLAVWAVGDKLGGIPLMRDPETGRFAGRGRVLLASDVKPVGGLFELALDAEGHALLAWSETDPNSGELEMHLTAPDVASKEEAPIQSLGPARPLGVVADSTGGFWLLSTREGDVRLRHLETDGTPTQDSEELLVVSSDAKGAQLTTWGNGDGVAVLVEGMRASVRLHIFAPGGVRMTPAEGLNALDQGAVNARGPHFAAKGTRFLVAWTDSRSDSADVYYRLIDLANLDRPAQRWNQDVDSADQVHASLASDGQRALVAWEDGRRGTTEIFVRALTQTGDNDGALRLGREGSLNSEPLGAQVFPSLAMGGDGQALVTWKEDLAEGGWILRAHITDAAGRAVGAARDLDTGHTASRKFPAACLALPGNAGYLVAWVRMEPEGAKGATTPLIQRLGHDGLPVGRAHELAIRGATDAQNLSMAFGDDGRILVVWDQYGLTSKRMGKKKPKVTEARALAGRFVAPSGSPLGQVLSFPPSPEGGDFDPDIAANLGGGFLLAWTGDEGPTRDVFARFLDARGRPEGPPLAMSVRANEQDYPEVLRLADGRLFVAWEDDISGIDHGFIREVKSARGKAGRRAELGPRYLIDATTTLFVEDRHAPLLAPLGRGLVAVWDDLGRGKGHDVAARFWLPD